MQVLLPGSLQAPDVPGEERLSPDSPGVLQADPEVGVPAERCAVGWGISGLVEWALNSAPSLTRGQKPPRRPAALGLSAGLFPLLTDTVSQGSCEHTLVSVVLLWREVTVEEEAEPAGTRVALALGC